jgi:transcriptional regulator NrdR family protein
VRTDGAQRRRQCTACGQRFTTIEVLKDEHQRREAIIQEAVALAEKLTAGA